MNQRGYIGGEKLIPLSLLFSFNNGRNNLNDLHARVSPYNINYTFGGHSSLLAIADHLACNNDECILIPSFTCESVIVPFKQRGINYRFYDIGHDLLPDLDDIESKLRFRVKAILFIDYMGSSTGQFIRPIVEQLKAQHVQIIQDAVQCVHLGKHELYGDFVFNSYRKITGLEGSVLLSKEKMQINFSTGKQLSFLFYKRAGQVMRFLHLKFQFIDAKYFLRLFNHAETRYKSSKIFGLPFINRTLINKMDFDTLAESNQIIFNALLNKLSPWTPKRFQNFNFTPFGFFLVRPDRDTLLPQLRSKSIFCPVHWKIPSEAKSDNHSGSSEIISRQCFTIPFSYPLTMELNTLLSTIDEIMTEKYNVAI